MKKNVTVYHRVVLIIILIAPSFYGFHSASADVPTVNDIYIEFSASPNDTSIILFTIRHSGPTLTHNIVQIELEVDGETIQLAPLPPNEQVGTTIIEYNFTIQINQFTNIRARARCSVHGLSPWTRLNNRRYKLIIEDPLGAGTTAPSSSTYLYEQVEEIQVTAAPSTGWVLGYWLLDGINMGNVNPISVTLDRDKRLQAVFTDETSPQVNFTLNINEPTGMGQTEPASGVYLYHENEMVTINAVPETDWTLSHWILDGANSGNSNPLTIRMDIDHDLMAVFIEAPSVNLYTLTIEEPEGQGTVDPEPGSIVYFGVTSVTLTAQPFSEWQFDHWVIDNVNSGSENPLTFSVDADHTIKAVFQEIEEPSNGGIPGYGALSLILGIILFFLIKTHDSSQLSRVRGLIHI